MTRTGDATDNKNSAMRVLQRQCSAYWPPYCKPWNSNTTPSLFHLCRPLHLRRPTVLRNALCALVNISNFVRQESQKRHTNNNLMQSASEPNLTLVKGWWDIDDKHLTAILAAGCGAVMHRWMQLLLHTSCPP